MPSGNQNNFIKNIRVLKKHLLLLHYSNMTTLCQKVWSCYKEHVQIPVMLITKVVELSNENDMFTRTQTYVHGFRYLESRIQSSACNVVG